MGYKFNPFTNKFDIDTDGVVDRLQILNASLAAFDKVQSVTYLDAGTTYERIDTVVYTSADHPDANMTKTVTWLDAGTMKQRIDKEEMAATVISPDSLRKTYSYTLVGIKYRLTGYEYEIF